MIPEADIYKLVENCNAAYIQIYDTNNRKLNAIEDAMTAQRAVEQLREVLPMYRSYGKVIIKAATENVFKSKYKGCFQWVCNFSGNAMGNPNMMGNQMGHHLNYPMQMPPGYVSSEVMLAK